MLNDLVKYIGTIIRPPFMTVKMAATITALHSRQRETRFTLLTSLGATHCAPR